MHDAMQTTPPNPPPASVRLAGALFSAYAGLLLLEALWIAIGSRWWASARAWSDLHPAGTVPKQMAAAAVVLLLVWGLSSGKRWLWFLIVSWGTLLAALGAFFLLAVATQPLAREFARTHPAESVAGVVTWTCVSAGVACLWRGDARRSPRR
jgi:hypothetical protein